MARCEDFPCCGHEAGCCPDFDPNTGEQLNMVCTCGAKLPIDNPVSICDACLRRGMTADEEDFFGVDDSYLASGWDFQDDDDGTWEDS